MANFLLASGCNVVERTQIMSLAGQGDVQVMESNGFVDLVRIGQLANVDYLVVGSVTLDNRLSVDFWTGGPESKVVVTGATARVVDAKNAQVVVAVTYEPGRGSGWHRPVVVGQEIGRAILGISEK